MVNILTAICQGKGTDQSIDQLKRLSAAMKAASVCGLGSMAPDPVLTALQFFGEEFEAHVNDRQCTADVCSMGEAQAV